MAGSYERKRERMVKMVEGEKRLLCLKTTKESWTEWKSLE